MSAEEKAIELVNKYRNPFNRKGCIPPTESMFPSTAKQCALIAVDEMLDIRNGLYINEGSIAHQWLLEVKQEINKL
jgi:hypothetical protein